MGYQEDVAYEVWKQGGDSDYIDVDRVSGSETEGISAESAAAKEINASKSTRMQNQMTRDGQFYDRLSASR